MKIRDLASIAEIVGTVAVVVSLVFVIRSIDQNTRAIGAAEANNIWQAWREVAVLPTLNNQDFAATSAKVANSEVLSDVEQYQWDRYLAAAINVWAQLFDLYSNDLISQDFWDYWNNGYLSEWEEQEYGRIWNRIRNSFDPDFQQHIDSQVGINAANQQ